MAREIFVDTSGWYALLDRRDAAHRVARGVVAAAVKARRVLVTTDYIIDEALTLTKARAGSQAAEKLLDLVESTRALRFQWIGPEGFELAKRFFRRHGDHGYSFTDCTSFEVMRESGMTEALTTDSHFRAAGFVVLLEQDDGLRR